jgi:hypothetical protein
LGRIELNVCFGSNGNYRKEKLEFEVMDWPSQYHAILGRPAFAKFMAVPHYAYLTLKIPGPKGTITVQESFEVANTCDREFNRMAQTFGGQWDCSMPHFTFSMMQSAERTMSAAVESVVRLVGLSRRESGGATRPPASLYDHDHRRVRWKRAVGWLDLVVVRRRLKDKKDAPSPTNHHV